VDSQFFIYFTVADRQRYETVWEQESCAIAKMTARCALYK